MGKGSDVRENMASLRNSKEFNEESLENVKKERRRIEFVILKVHLNCNMENRWEGEKPVAEYKSDNSILN